MDALSPRLTPNRLRSLPSWLLNQTAVHASRLVSEGLADQDSRRYHYSLLAALSEFGPASQAELGRRCGIDRSDMVAVVTELADRGLVERNPDPADRRRNTVTITPAGARHLHTLDRLLAGIQADLLAPLSPTEREQFTALLTRLLDHHTRG
jgi:DNA-binding MarR family transcriptional regulator